MFKIILSKPGMSFDMPNDRGLRLLEACYLADIYKKHNSSATFTVVNEENGDVEYQV